MKTINDFMKTHLPSDYNGFSVDEFLSGKELRIESVRADKIQGRRCIKTDVRIVQDDNDVNKNKVFTVRLDETNDFEEGEFEAFLKETKNYLGYPLIVETDKDVKQAYFFQQNMLTLVVKDYFVETNAEKQDVELTSMKDRPLKDIGKYRVFDIKQLIEDNELTFEGTYNEKGNIMFNTLLNNTSMIKIAVPVERYDALPASFLTLNKPFNSCVEDYTFETATSHRYGTRWTLRFKDITFKPGVISKEAYTLSYEEPVLEVADVNRSTSNEQETKVEKEESVNETREPSHQSQSETTREWRGRPNPFKRRRQI